MNIIQYSAVKPDIPAAGLSGTVLRYDVLTTGHDGKGNRDTSSFAKGCFDDFLKSGPFNIPILMDHDKSKIVGFVNELVSFDNVVRFYGCVFDVRVFDMNYMGISVGTTCHDVSNCTVTRASIDEITLTENPADRSGKVDPKAIFKL